MDINLLTALSDNIRIDRDKCTACGRCVNVCILDNLRLQLSPCRQACPLGMNCQGYIHHLARGKTGKGLEKIKETIPFGGILGRICSMPCESACNRIKVDGRSVAIRDLKRFLADGEDEPQFPEAASERPEKIAIVGAGPAGLAAAFFLRRAGFKVTLFDREPAPGGLLRWAIPEFRLPLSTLERELRFLDAMGVAFTGNATLGRNLHLADLEKDYDAVLLAVGAHGEVRLGIPGEESSDVLPVLAFMRAAREGEIHRIGEDVVVVGGGNSAIDAAQTALRLGAKKVTLVPLEKREDMPAFAWSIAEAEEEGVAVLNGWGPQSLRFDGGRLRGVTFRKCLSHCDETGCFAPSYDEAVTMDLSCDTVIAAIGQKTEASLAGPAGCTPGGIACDPVTFQTEHSRIFAVGDFLRGGGTAVEAMAQGREAAVSIERLLHDEDLRYERGAGKPYEFEFQPDWDRAIKRGRVAMPALPLAQRRGFEEVVKGFSKEQAIAEAERCLGCGVPFGLRTCWFCLPCEIECPEEALYVEIPYLLR